MLNSRARALLGIGVFLSIVIFEIGPNVIASSIQALATAAAGGTGRTTLTAHSPIVGEGTSPVGLPGPGSSGQCFVSQGAASDPSWQLCPGGGSGGGITVYSGSAVTVAAGTYYFPVGGGAVPSSTETNVDVESPSAATVTNFYVQLSVALGAGNTGVFTWRKAATGQSLTCTISGASASTCNDIIHSFTVAQGDLIDVQLVTTGTIVVTPNIVMAVQFGTTGSNGTVNTGTINQLAYYAAGGSAVSGGGSAQVVAAFTGCSGVLYLGADGACHAVAAGGTTTSSGAIASLPMSPGTAGNVYICTDSPYQFVSNGSTWDAYVFGYKVTQPVLGNFTQIKVDKSTFDTTHGGIIWTVPANSNVEDVQVLGVAPGVGGSYCVDAAFTYLSGAQNGAVGSGFSANLTSTTAFSFVAYGQNLSTTPAAYAKRYTTPTTGATNLTSGLIPTFLSGPLVWTRMQDDGTTNRTYFISPNGYTWYQIFQEGRTSTYTPVDVIFAISPYSFQSTVQLLHFLAHSC